MKEEIKQVRGNLSTRVSLPFFAWLGGFMFVWNQPGMTFWDGLIWIYYVGRYVAQHFTALSY